MDDEITVIIDGKTATDEQTRELFRLYEEHGLRHLKDSFKRKRIRHFTLEYAKARAIEHGHV